jgi:hypothetical protein
LIADIKPTLKKPFTLLLIFSHLNAFVLGVGGMGNVYAANQVVDTTKSPTTFIDTTANGGGGKIMLLKLLGMLNCLL